jgi:hypothetical protein
MSSTAYQLIRQAILEKRCIGANYNGLRRMMCPHVLGVSKKGEVLEIGAAFGLRN